MCTLRHALCTKSDASAMRSCCVPGPVGAVSASTIAIWICFFIENYKKAVARTPFVTRMPSQEGRRDEDTSVARSMAEKALRVGVEMVEIEYN